MKTQVDILENFRKNYKIPFNDGDNIGPFYISWNTSGGKVQSLHLTGSGIKCLWEIEEFEQLTDIKYLYLAGNQLKTLEGIENLKNLNLIELGESHYGTGRNIEKIQGLESLVNLEELNLSFNKIQVIEGLKNLTNLKTLSLEHNKITNIQNLERLTNLQDLYLSHNNLQERQKLGGLKSLESLFLVFNQITELYLSEDLEKLEWLSLDGNPIRKLKINCRLNHLGLSKEHFSCIKEFSYRNDFPITVMGIKEMFLDSMRAKTLWRALNKDLVSKLQGSSMQENLIATIERLLDINMKRIHDEEKALLMECPHHDYKGIVFKEGKIESIFLTNELLEQLPDSFIKIIDIINNKENLPKSYLLNILARRYSCKQCRRKVLILKGKCPNCNSKISKDTVYEIDPSKNKRLDYFSDLNH